MAECVYLLDEINEQTEDGRQIYGCQLHQSCIKEGITYQCASCETCRDRLLLTDKDFGEKFKDQLIVTDRDKNRTHVFRDMLAGRPSFLVCGGPSAKRLPLDQLGRRGVYSLAVNNAAGYSRVNAFVCSDPPSKFHNGIWLDPWVDKFIPTPKLNKKRGRLRRKVGNEFEHLLDANGERVSACHCPRVWGFGRRSWFKPDESFFLDDQAPWGNHDSGVKRTGEEKTVCTMMLGIRLLYYLGSRRIYLVGVDFWMDPEKDLLDNYSFGEERDESAVSSNNRQYRVVNRWLCKMQDRGIFEKFGVEIYNCNPNSGLKAFAHVPFDLAMRDALKDFPEEPFDLRDWYKK